MTVARFRLVAALAVIAALGLPTLAEAAWQYRGRVADGHRTPIELVVRHVQAEPRQLIYAATGRLRLDCPRATQRFRWTLGLGFPLRFAPNGRVGITATEASGGGGRVHRIVHSRFDGRVRRRRAAGILHVTTRTHRFGRCDSGRLHWHARFVPPAS